jgi:hypothetical protein
VPYPTGYTEQTLADFLIIELSDIGTILGWTADLDIVTAAVNDVEGWLGVSDVADSVEVTAIRALGAVAIWRRAVKALSSRYTVSEDQQKYDRSDLLKNAQAALAIAESEAGQYLQAAATPIRLTTLDYVNDPYRYVDNADRVIL